jgi:hypothetical protein
VHPHLRESRLLSSSWREAQSRCQCGGLDGGR